MPNLRVPLHPPKVVTYFIICTLICANYIDEVGSTFVLVRKELGANAGPVNVGWHEQGKIGVASLPQGGVTGVAGGSVVANIGPIDAGIGAGVKGAVGRIVAPGTTGLGGGVGAGIGANVGPVSADIQANIHGGITNTKERQIHYDPRPNYYTPNNPYDISDLSRPFDDRLSSKNFFGLGQPNPTKEVKNVEVGADVNGNVGPLNLGAKGVLGGAVGDGLGDDRYLGPLAGKF